jgi:hypothetical protein
MKLRVTNLIAKHAIKIARASISITVLAGVLFQPTFSFNLAFENHSSD